MSDAAALKRIVDHYQCKICSRTYPTFEKWRAHRDQFCRHTGRPQEHYAYACRKCPFVSERRVYHRCSPPPAVSHDELSKLRADVERLTSLNESLAERVKKLETEFEFTRLATSS